ncbi:uncharacterized protein LOC108898602 isoform X1 [Lates calcarifer]|uniref:Uncharacterized protein LOC108898602 isoform X1 n=1 Tax=Lates calcarifer TaxID=8187 RepID=A0AAJ8BCG2_LATCA|nr:uncharacterized protein LOC108898602 isoform X1 [Lates calcarifer]
MPEMTTLPETVSATTTLTTVLPPMTTTPTALSLTTTTATTTSAPNTTAVTGTPSPSHDKKIGIPRTDNKHVFLEKLLIISVILNVVLPLLVYLCMRRRTQDSTQSNVTWMELEAQPMQPIACHSDVTLSAETTRNGCAGGSPY